jgi:hypothetical protein
MSDKSEATTTPAASKKRGRGRPRGSKTKPRDPTTPRAPRKYKPMPPPPPVEKKSWSRREFCARHGIGSLNTYAAMLKRGDGPVEMILGEGPHAVRRISVEAEARWIAEREAVVITEEEREADREQRAAAIAAREEREAREEQEAAARAPRGKNGT